MRLQIQVDMDNDAFTDEAIEQELTRIFALIAAQVTCGAKYGPEIKRVLDLNGNTCCKWSIKD